MSKLDVLRAASNAFLISTFAVTLSNCSSVTIPSAALAGQVSIVDNKLIRDGKPWVPHRFFQIAFQASPNEVNVPKFETQATSDYTPVEYTQMAAAGADSVRVMIGQTAGDPLTRFILRRSPVILLGP